MLLIPLYRKIDWREPPVITVLLILLNVFVYFGVQGRDDEREYEAVQYYLGSALPDIEFPAFADYLKSQERFAEAERAAALAGRRDEGRIALVYAMHRHAEFARRLRADQVITPEHPAYEQWRSARARFEALSARVITRSYGFTPAEQRPVTFLSHMFLHGSAAHLIGNMLFLFLVGFSVEAALGRKAFLAFYLATGLGAVSLFWAVYPESVVPLVGASGAIAGLTGLYTVLFGLRRITFFCFVFVYFNFFKAPAILLLPLWLANELYQLFFGGISNVAYVAHIGGLLSGALVGVLAKRWLAGINLDYLDRAAKEEQQLADLEAGMKLIAELKLEPARKVFEGLLEQDPQNRSVLRQLYAIAKFKPDSAPYHDYAKRLLAQAGNDAQTNNLVREIFHDYVRTAKPPRLNSEDFAGLAMRFARGGDLEDAERIVAMLSRRPEAQPRLPACLLALAEASRRAQRSERCRLHLQRLVTEYPRTAEAQEARQLLALAGVQEAPG